jgi:signal transduction histidine kinase
MRAGEGYEETTDRLTGEKTLYVALASRRIDMIVQVGHKNPPSFAVLGRAQLMLILGMALALGLTLWGSWIASQKVSLPLKALTTSARRINAGELGEVIAVRSRAAEFQDLANSLDAMADHFRDDIRQLQRLIRIQNEFLGNVSHEVRNPIFAIGGYLEALGSPGLQERQRQRYVNKGVANLERLNNLFSDLVEIARLEYREDILQQEVFDIQTLVMEVAETARMKAEEKDLRLDVDNDSMQVKADRNRIAQVLTNLMENAIAYTDNGQIKCTLERMGEKVRVSISDSGHGIGAEHLERIFDRFYRVDTARSRTHGGTGLGLSIVKQILHAHGETIQVQSEEGKGTSFWFELPFMSESRDAETHVA